MGAAVNWFLAKPRTLATWSAACFILGMVLAPARVCPADHLDHSISRMRTFAWP